MLRERDILDMQCNIDLLSLILISLCESRRIAKFAAKNMKLIVFSMVFFFVIYRVFLFRVEFLRQNKLRWIKDTTYINLT